MTQTLILPKILHIESTDACQAACPQCAREVDEDFDKNNLHHLTVDQIKELLSEDTIKNLDKMFMCGDYGDPAAGKHTLEIYRYFRSINPTITLGMNTNGGLRDTEWWITLAEIFSGPLDYVVFSIDGLEDTNHIYRINVNWNSVIKNVQTFIQHGGSAHWDMLVFEHNEHQINDCEQLARKLGFKWFRTKVSKRNDQIPISFLKPPKGYDNPVINSEKIYCQAIKEQSIYISANGIVYPCCWLGTTDYTLDHFDYVKDSWKNNPIKQCHDACSGTDAGTNFTNQWQHEIELT